MSSEKILSVLRMPHVSEKAARLQELSNQYVFEVSQEATKADVKAVETLFEVKVEDVNLLTVKGKRKTFRSRRSPWRLAQGVRQAGRRPVDRRDGQALR